LLKLSKVINNKTKIIFDLSKCTMDILANRAFDLIWYQKLTKSQNTIMMHFGSKSRSRFIFMYLITDNEQHLIWSNALWIGLANRAFDQMFFNIIILFSNNSNKLQDMMHYGWAKQRAYCRFSQLIISNSRKTKISHNNNNE